MANGIRKVGVGFWFFWGIAMFCGFGLLAWILFHFAAPQEPLDSKRGKARSEKLAALRKENDAKLNTFAWVSKDKGVVQIPIERAMELVVNDLKSKPVQASAVPLEEKYPYGLQPAAAAPAPSAASGTKAPETKK